MGYPKIWTSILEEPWWKKWGGLTRGCFLQLIMLMKNGDDTGVYVAHSYTKLSNDMSIDRRTARDQCTIMSRDSGLVVYKNAQGQLMLSHPKYRFYQDLNAKTHAEYIKTRGQKSGENVPLLDQSILDQSKAGRKAASNVDNSKEEIKPTDHVLYAQWKDWREENLIDLEALALNFPGVPKQFNRVEFFNSVIEDVETQICINPEKFRSQNFMGILKGYLKKQAELGKLGDYGMKGMSAAEERTHEEKKQSRAGSREFDDGSGVESC